MLHVYTAAFPSVGTGVRYAPPRTPRRVNKEEGVVLAIRDRIVSRGCCCSIRRKPMSYGGTGAKPLCGVRRTTLSLQYTLQEGGGLRPRRPGN